MAVTTTDPRSPFLTVAQAADELAVTERQASAMLWRASSARDAPASTT